MLEVIIGGMFAGKTEELLRRLERHAIAKRKVALVKPDIDTRENVTHSGQVFQPTVIGSRDRHALAKIIMQNDVIGIDEAEFFGTEIYELIKIYEQSGTGKIIIACGLDMDSDGEPFGIMPKLMAIAHDVTKLHAVCENCYEPANISYSLVEKKSQVLVGGKDKYKALCWKCAVEEDEG